MWLIIGLGNPGVRYAEHRHNVGFQIIDHFCSHHHLHAHKQQHQSIFTTGNIDHKPILLAKPQTYMNLSGEAVSSLCQTFSISPQELIVIHDELDLPFGKMVFKRGGGTGGHNGLRSISASLETNDYLRLRFGIGRPLDTEMTITDHVLSSFCEDEKRQIPALFELATKMLECCLSEGEHTAMNLYNRK